VSSDLPLKEDSLLREERRWEPGSTLKRAAPVPAFDSWRDIPDTLKTKRSWLRSGRKVKKESKRAGYFVRQRFADPQEDLAVLDLLSPQTVTRDEEDDLVLVADMRANLYKIDQTVPYTPSARTQATWDFADIYLANACRDDWLLTKPGEGWSTVRPEKQSFYSTGVLTHDTIISHLNHTRVVGVKNRSGRTRFIMLDLDFHNRDRDVFLEMAEILLREFNGDTWHAMTRADDINGLHLIRVFPKAVDLKDAVAELREQLNHLDQQHSELAERAIKAGMPSFGKIEIYPTCPSNPIESNKNGIRLPLSAGRVTITDQYLMPVKRKKTKQKPRKRKNANQKRVRADTTAPVESYIRWLKDPNRKPLNIEHTLEFLKTFTFEAPARAKSAHSYAQTTKGWKNNTRRLICDFWLDGEPNGISLNSHIAVLVRAAAFYGHHGGMVEQRINEMVRSLPRQVSQRLIKGKMREVEHSIKTAIDAAYSQNDGQKDAAASSRKLQNVANRWQSIGFDPLWPSRIASTGRIKPVAIEWPEGQKARLTESLRPLFKNAQDGELSRLVEEVVKLVVRMGDHPWGQSYFKTWVMDRFPTLNLGNNTKRSRVLLKLRELRILARVQKGLKGHGASVWNLGEVGSGLVSGKDASLTLGQEQEATPPAQATSGLSASKDLSVDDVCDLFTNSPHPRHLYASISLCPIFSGDVRNETIPGGYWNSS
jgi:hypothetical protein